MDLPALDWQFFYGRLAWTIVLATLVASLLPAALRRSRPVIGGLMLAMAALMALPDSASPAYWLVLAFQWPSGVLLGCCLLKLYTARAGSPAIACMPTGIAAVIALVGSVLYLDAIGLLSLGLYYWGFGPYGAPLVALGAGASCALAVVLGRVRPHALIALGALALFSILRLPTGNLWDALLDPLLWGWAVIALAIQCGRWLARKRRGAQQSGRGVEA
ncbi:hypothetical protein HHL21_17935 [Massilia sp. RP-1-19]|uniref:Uncharacterized protein n=1 Tax=Massilia polaris TaxID=2728846 RepID=A0A848HNJ7_9BURK|nr:hypothetical protein [Massilia polaris]NML62925.1 hypothetical protein [Massilia polaris]